MTVSSIVKKLWLHLAAYVVSCPTSTKNLLKVVHNYIKCVPKKVDWAKLLNWHSSKSIWMIKLPFCQNEPPMGESFWQKDSLMTHILFELCRFRYLSQSTVFWYTLYLIFFSILRGILNAHHYNPRFAYFLPKFLKFIYELWH